MDYDITLSFLGKMRYNEYKFLNRNKSREGYTHEKGVICCIRSGTIH